MSTKQSPTCVVKSEVPVTDKLFGDNLVALIKEMKELDRLAPVWLQTMRNVEDFSRKGKEELFFEWGPRVTDRMSRERQTGTSSSATSFARIRNTVLRTEGE